MASTKTRAAKAGFKAFRAMPAKGRVVRAAPKAVSSATYVRALAGDKRERRQLQEAYRAGRKAYDRASKRGGGVDLAKLVEDRRARRNASAAVASLRAAGERASSLRRRRKQKRNGGVIAIVAVTGAGTVVLLNKGVRDKVLGRQDAETQQPAKTVQPA